MITCAITAESKRALRKAIYIFLTERINQKSKFDLKDITKDIYDIIFTSTGEHAQGLNYARLVPEIIFQLRNRDTDVRTYLRGSLEAVSDMQYEFEKEDGLKAVEDFLGVNIDIPELLKSEQPRYTSEEEREAAPKQEPLTPEDFTPTSFQKGDRVKINTITGGEATVVEDRGDKVLLDNGRPPILKKNLELILPTQGVLQPTEKGSADDLQGKGRTEPILTQPTTTTTKSQTETVDNQVPTTINIYAGTGENAELSNFAKRPFEIEFTGWESFDTVEGAFQAVKLSFADGYFGKDGLFNEEGQKIWDKLKTASGAEAKRIGRTIKNLDTKKWDAESSTLMKIFLQASFEQNETALKKLLATGNAKLTHTQDKGKWGKEFPKLLMKVRDQLAQPQITEGVADLFESDPKLANAVYEAVGLNTINVSEITYTDEEGNPCAKMGLTNTVKGADWKIVKDFKGQPKHSNGGVDITISDKGVTMRRGGKDIKAKHGLLIPNNN